MFEPLYRWKNCSNAKYCKQKQNQSISGLVAEYIVAIDVTRVRFPADAWFSWGAPLFLIHHEAACFASIQAVIAQLVARRSHNPKVVSSILTHRIFQDTKCITITSSHVVPFEICYQRIATSARSVAASYKPPMLVTRVRLPACAFLFWLF